MKRRGVPTTTPLVDKHLLSSVLSFKNDVKTLLKTPVGGNPLQGKYSVNKHKGEAGGKHGDVFFVGLKDKSSDQTFAIKRQVINSPKHLTDRSYRELLIFQHLNQLALDNKCVNFVEIIDWFKATPNIMTPERQGSKQLMHFVLEFADGATLNDYRENKLNLTQYKCILFQVVYALHIAQKEYEFVHNDLHLRNILLKTLPHDKKYVSVTDGDKSWVLQGYIAKLTDFGLSRITTKAGSVIYNFKSPTSQAFTDATDIEKLSESLGSIKVDIEDATEKSALLNLRRLMRKGVPPKTLLSHEFFNSLKERPLDCTQSNTISVNSTGAVPLRDLTNTYITPGPTTRISILTPLSLPFFSLSQAFFHECEETNVVVMDDVKRELVFTTPSHPSSSHSPASSDEEPLSLTPHRRPFSQRRIPKVPKDTRMVTESSSEDEEEVEEEEEEEKGDVDMWITPKKQPLQEPLTPTAIPTISISFPPPQPPISSLPPTQSSSIPSIPQPPTKLEQDEDEEVELKRQIVKQPSKSRLTRGDSGISDLTGKFSKVSVSAENDAPPAVTQNELRRSARLRNQARR